MQLFISLFVWIISLQEVAWFLIGGSSIAALIFLYIKLKNSNKFSLGSYLLSVVAVFLFAFALLWAVASWEENEVIAANLGLVIFGGFAAIFGIIAYRLITKEGDESLIKRLIPISLGKKSS